MWLMTWYETMLRKSTCAMAPMTPTINVSPEIQMINVWVIPGCSTKISVKTRISEYTPTLVRSPPKIADTAGGGASYDFGNQK